MAVAGRRLCTARLNFRDAVAARPAPAADGMNMALRLRLCLLLASLLWPLAASAQPAPFDLAGPDLDVRVTHNGATLPISQTPNLAEGDQLSIRADLPAGESVHYLLVAAFLRGATNPPPPEWFFRAETWTRKGRDGVKMIVPAGAEQVVVFLAPQTGGDFATLRDAVRGRPGAFVRASQDLNQAALDRSRLDAFLNAVRKTDPTDPDRLKTVSPLLARSLTIKLNTDCFQKTPELQAPCLMQGSDTLVLNDGHSTSIVEALTGGPSADLALQLSASPVAHLGYYSPYVAAVFDMARIMDSFRTAQFQYIPALPLTREDHVSLLLNTPPSFHNPLSVLVTALPAVEPPQSPPLEPVDPKQVFCAERTDLVLPVEGAPLAYSTRYAHDMTLRVQTKDGRTVDLPVHADAEKGGFIADTSGFSASDFGDAIDGSLHGYWGFQPFDGPAFHLRNAHAGPWRLAADDEAGLIVGRDDTVRLEGEQAACVSGVDLKGPGGTMQPVDWKSLTADRLSVTLPLSDAQPGPVTLLVRQYGMKDADAVPLQAYAQAGRLDSLTLHAGDTTGVLKGSRLDEVAGAMLDGIAYQPGALSSSGGSDELVLNASDSSAIGDKLRAGRNLVAKVTLKDGRKVNLKLAVGAPRPRATLIGKNVQEGAGGAGAIPLKLSGADQLPQDARLTFSVRAEDSTRFTDGGAIEVATADGSVSTRLTPGAGLTLEDPHVALATLDVGKALGPSAFGPLQFRVVVDGSAGDWQPLAELVRLPVLQGVHCPKEAMRPCQLAGTNLFLIDSVADNAAFEHPMKVPEGFPGDSLAVPHPRSGRLYLRLHDDPQVVNEAVLPG